jgi:hypothetical protein
LQRSIGLLDCRRDFRTRLEIALVPRHGLGAAWRPDDSTPRGRLLRCGSSTHSCRLRVIRDQGGSKPRHGACPLCLLKWTFDSHAACLLGAKSGLVHRSKTGGYSTPRRRAAGTIRKWLSEALSR